jgi:hypothetical protein
VAFTLLSLETVDVDTFKLLIFELLIDFNLTWNEHKQRTYDSICDIRYIGIGTTYMYATNYGLSWYITQEMHGQFLRLPFHVFLYTR